MLQEAEEAQVAADTTLRKGLDKAHQKVIFNFKGLGPPKWHQTK